MDPNQVSTRPPSGCTPKSMLLRTSCTRYRANAVFPLFVDFLLFFSLLTYTVSLTRFQRRTEINPLLKIVFLFVFILSTWRFRLFWPSMHGRNGVVAVNQSAEIQTSVLHTGLCLLSPKRHGTEQEPPGCVRFLSSLELDQFGGNNPGE